MIYKVIIYKWVFVAADSEDEAMDKAENSDIIWDEEETSCEDVIGEDDDQC